ncbi:PAS domain-containing protein [Deinococcus yavapaiensis]|uniref:histidine kinase n=1 Tax=Deinococcus yavapaiensis KR-236 TaxID=694435 RepID=A0A318SH35_9DEIO|nr:PAS domain-containing protein [Deinococcus yavapaiensis]PYE49961.1 PAS domain S-box-containing protein [Deinococcus yavapaiensis KR-236]
MSVPSDVRFLSAEVWRSVFDTVSTPTWLADDDGRIVHANVALAAHLGRLIDSLAGFFPLDAAHADDRRDMWPRWEAARRERRSFEATCRLDAGRGPRWTRLDLRPLGGDGAPAWVGTLADVHDAVTARSEDEVRRARDEWRATRPLDTLFEASPVGMAFLDRDLRFVHVNTALAELNGLPAHAHLGRTAMELLPGLDDGAFAALRHVVVSGEALRNVTVEGETPALPGVRRAWREDFYPVRGMDGEVAGVGIMAVEMTPQARVQAALVESEARFRRLVDASPIGMVLGLPDGRITLANDAYLRIVGYSREEFELGLVDWARLTPPEYLPLDVRALRDVEERGHSDSYEKEYERRDGTRVPVQCTIAAFEGDSGQVAGYVVDLTALKEAERALLDLNATLERRVRERTQQALQLQEQLATVARSLPIILYAIDEHGRFTLSEGRGLTDLGLTPGEAVGRNVFELYGAEDGVLDDVRRALAGEEVRSQQTVGDQVFDVTYAPKLDASGRPDGFLGVSINVTDRARAERSLAHRNEELRRSNEELERFAYVASHDLQAPIRAVTSFADLVAQRYSAALDDRGRAYLAQIMESGQHMKRLVDDLLAFSRLHTEQRPFEPVAANDVFDRVALRFAADVDDALVHVTRDDLPTVLADAPQFDSLLQNLVSNGLKYAREGVTPMVRVSATRDEAMWHFRVTDNGIGIEDKYFERIFVIFQRLHGRERFEGTGIGLAVCKKIVERHGGRLWVESRVGVGSTFHFTLPAP